MSKRSIYFSAPIERILCIDDESHESFSGRVSYLITLADMLSREQMPSLTEQEWCAIVYANAGSYHDYSAGVIQVLGGLWHNLFDYATEGDTKWGIDCVALARRMRAMPIGAQAAVFEAVKKYWDRFEGGESDLINIDILREVTTVIDRGLVN